MPSPPPFAEVSSTSSDSYHNHLKQYALSIPPSYSETTLVESEVDFAQVIFGQLARLEKVEIPVDTEIVITKGSPKLDTLSKKEDPSRVFYPGEMIMGEISVTNNTDRIIPFETFLVTLEGTVETPGHVAHTILRAVDHAASEHGNLDGEGFGRKDAVDGVFYGFSPTKRLLPGRAYKKFFHFIVPQALLDTVCEHQLEEHMELPPTTKDFLGAIRYKVTARLIGTTTGREILCHKEDREVVIGNEAVHFENESTLHQLEGFERRVENVIDNLEGKPQRKAEVGDEERLRFSQQDVTSNTVSVSVPSKRFGDATEDFDISAKISGKKVIINLSTSLATPPHHIYIEPKLREIFVSSKSSLPISIDQESLLRRVFSQKLKRQCKEQYEKMKDLAITKNATVPASTYHGLHSLSNILYNERTLKGWFKTVKDELKWHHGETHIEFPLEYITDKRPGASFQTCYLGRWYQVVLLIKIKKRIVEVALPFSK